MSLTVMKNSASELGVLSWHFACMALSHGDSDKWGRPGGIVVKASHWQADMKQHLYTTSRSFCCCIQAAFVTFIRNQTDNGMLRKWSRR